MNRMRTVIGVLLAVLLSAFALPGLAASSTKYFFATFPAVVPAGTGNIALTVYNATPPPGVSTINSMEIDAPPGVTINSISNGTLTPKGGGVYYVNNMTGIKNGQHPTLTLNVTVAGVNCVAETWGIAANTGNAYPQGDSFTDQHPAGENLVSAVGCEGTLFCNTQLSDVNPTLGSGQQSTLGRGPKDANGSDCTGSGVPYSADFISNGSQTFVFIEISGAQRPTVEYVLSWNPVAIAGWPAFQPNVAWLNANGSPTSQPGTPAFVPAQVCLSDNLNDPTNIMPTMPAVAPYTGAPYYADGLTVKAKMCVAEQGWAVVNGQIQYWDRVIDQGDGHVQGP